MCTGGIVYTIIHNVPWFKFERNEFGTVVVAEYFMKGQRGQWAGEGYIVSFLTTLAGIALLLLTRAQDLFKTTGSRRTFIIIDLIVIFLLI